MDQVVGVRIRGRTKLAIVLAALVAVGALSGTAAAKPKGKVQAKLHQGTLTVTGSKQDDDIALRLRAGDPSVLEVVVEGERTDDFKSGQVDRIEVDGDKGDDTIAIDEYNVLIGTSIRTGGRQPPLQAPRGASSLLEPSSVG